MTQSFGSDLGSDLGSALGSDLASDLKSDIGSDLGSDHNGKVKKRERKINCVFAAHVLVKLTIFDEIMEKIQFDYFG